LLAKEEDRDSLGGVVEEKLDLVEMWGVWKVACVRGWNVRQLIMILGSQKRNWWMKK